MRNNADLLKAFRETRKQVQSLSDTLKPVGVHSKSNNGSKDYGEYFQSKYANLETWIDKFNAKDLVYFFIEKAKEAGVKYVVPNMAKECGIFKNFLKKYSSREICLMIEFVFNSNQNYLDKSTFSPSLLVSGWCNTIYHDSLLWVDDKFVPTDKRNSKPTKTSREWNKEVTVEKASIGAWEDE